MVDRPSAGFVRPFGLGGLAGFALGRGLRGGFGGKNMAAADDINI